MEVLEEFYGTESDPHGVLEAVDAALVNMCNAMENIRLDVVQRGGIKYAIHQIGDGSVVKLSSESSRLALILVRSLLFSENQDR